MELTDNDRFLVLFHYPMLSWNRQYHGSYHLFGHVHNNSFKHPHPNAFNVSVEVINYTPITFDDLLATRDLEANNANS
jgi:calcineurin-like phosphoesterase family protein